MVLFRGRVTVPQPNEEVYEGRVDPETCHEARTVAPGWDVFHLGHEWRKWRAAEEIEPKKPDRHFVKFCQSWFDKQDRL